MKKSLQFAGIFLTIGFINMNTLKNIYVSIIVLLQGAMG
jgi:hypothetical protein